MSVRAAAIVFAEPGRVEIRPVDIPDVGPDEVGVRTAYSGVSQGTERWLLTGRYNRAGEDVAANYPCYPGYQAAGIVERTGHAAAPGRGPGGGGAVPHGGGGLARRPPHWDPRRRAGRGDRPGPHRPDVGAGRQATRCAGDRRRPDPPPSGGFREVLR